MTKSAADVESAHGNRGRTLEPRGEIRFAEKIVETAREGIMVCDTATRIVWVNPAFTEITGFTAEEAIGATPRLLHSGIHDRVFYAAIWASLASTGRWQGEVWNRKKNGIVFPEWLHLHVIFDEHGTASHYVGTFSDLANQEELQRSLHKLAYFDSVTGLPNRNLFRDRLQQALLRAVREKSAVAVLFLDLDRFKDINDSLGHDTGDRLLKAVAERLADCMREGDTLSRLGGDEFTAILPDAGDAPAIAQVAGRIIQSLSSPFALADREVFVAASIGISFFPADGDDAETLIKHADIAMFQVKERGGGDYRFFVRKMNRLAQERLDLETDLRHALEREQLFLDYQPQFDLGSGRIAAVEALVRWRHPSRETLSPAIFIPLAEDIGYIAPIDAWVLQQAVMQHAAWQASGLPAARIAVNLSVHRFRRNGLAISVAKLLEETGLCPEQLELELTECIFQEDAETTLHTLGQLKDLGIRLSIDDFGTGFSSIHHLKRFPIDTLKIDRSFVAGIPGDRSHMDIVAASVALAHNLGMDVVAEGVETREQLAFLLRHGCDRAQGFLLSRPVDAVKIEHLLRTGPILPT